MSEEYPCALPLPLVNGFSYSDSNLTVFNDMDSGPPVARLKSDEGYTMFNVQFSFNPLQLQVFRSWYRSVIKHGSKTFTISLNIDGDTTTHTCYMSTPSYNLSGKRWRVNANLTSIEFAGLNDCDGLSAINMYDGNDSLNLNIAAIKEVIENDL